MKAQLKKKNKTKLKLINNKKNLKEKKRNLWMKIGNLLKISG